MLKPMFSPSPHLTIQFINFTHWNDCFPFAIIAHKHTKYDILVPHSQQLGWNTIPPLILMACIQEITHKSFITQHKFLSAQSFTSHFQAPPAPMSKIYVMQQTYFVFFKFNYIEIMNQTTIHSSCENLKSIRPYLLGQLDICTDYEERCKQQQSQQHVVKVCRLFFGNILQLPFNMPKCSFNRHICA